MENPEVQTPQIPATSVPLVPTLELVPFVQEKGKEIPDFNTVYYDRATKRIIKRTEKKVEAGNMPRKMITDTAVMLGINHLIKVECWETRGWEAQRSLWAAQ